MFAEAGRRVEYQVGTMIEVPRAALTSAEIAEHADFFSFGTNDLTQTTFAISRDDAEQAFLLHYLSDKILTENPFASIDAKGVGRLMRIALEGAREVKPDIETGVCGEHGGDPASIALCHEMGLELRQLLGLPHPRGPAGRGAGRPRRPLTGRAYGSAMPDTVPAPPFETIEVSVAGARGELWLARPDKLNPLSTQTLAELEEAARWFDRHAELKVVVVGGRGRSFSAGADLDSFRQGGGRADREQGWRMGRALEEMRAVTVARIQGWCVGGGLVVAAACDLRVAAASARFSIPEIDLGIPLAWGGIPRLVREIGPALTKELVMTGREFGPDEAKAAGFLNRVVADDELDSEVEALVVDLVAKPALSLLATKAHTNAVTESMVGTGRSWADADGLEAGLHDPEGRDARRRYLERRS